MQPCLKQSYQCIKVSQVLYRGPVSLVSPVELQGGGPQNTTLTSQHHLLLANCSSGDKPGLVESFMTHGLFRKYLPLGEYHPLCRTPTTGFCGVRS